MSAERNAFYLLRLQIMTEQGGHRGEVMGIFSRSIKEFRLNSIFVRIFIYIMALVLISIGLVSFFSYRKSSAMMISEVQNSNMLILKQAQKGIDQKINSLQANLMQAALNRSLNEVLYLSNQSNYDKYELIQDSMSYLSALKSNNNYISDIWLYAKKTDFVLGTESKYERSLFSQMYANIQMILIGIRYLEAAVLIILVRKIFIGGPIRFRWWFFRIPAVYR